MAVPVDPWAAAFMAGSNVLGQAMTAPPAGPSSAQLSGTYANDADFSGWNVNFGAGNIDSRATKTESKSLDAAGVPSMLGGGFSVAAGDWQTWAAVALLGVGLWAALRR